VTPILATNSVQGYLTYPYVYFYNRLELSIYNNREKMVISSLANTRIKQIRALRHRPERERSELFFIEGIRQVIEAVQLGAPIEQIVYAPELLKSELALETIQQQQKAGIICLEVTAEVFKSLSVKEGPQGIGAVVRQHWEPLTHLHLTNELCWVALDAAQDPGNIGTILRTADAVGSAGLILLGHCTDPYDPGALRASMGTIFSQRLIKASFEEFARWKKQERVFVVGTSGAAATDYRAARYPRPLVLLMGSEREGLSPQQQAICDLMVSIPMVGRSDSLNLAVATGIILYEIFYQARSATTPQPPRP
jgi:TrmH family RNA methyltransferase